MICFDTSPLIWGVRGQAEEGQEGMILRTQKFIRYLQKKKEKIAIPAPALAEYLVGSETAKKRKAELEEVFRRRFIIYPLDAPAAHKTAEIQEMDLVRHLVKQGGDRDKLKVDAMIIAIAIMRHADCIISNDPDFQRLAYGQIKVEPVPDVVEQTDFTTDV